MWPKYLLSIASFCTFTYHHCALRICSLAIELADSESLVWDKGKKRLSSFALRDSSQQPLVRDWTASFCNIKNHEISVFGGCFLSLEDSANTRLLHSKCSLKLLLPGECHPLTEILCSVVYCMQFYRQADDFVPVNVSWSACLWYFVSCVVCVQGWVYVLSGWGCWQPYMFWDTFLFPSRMIKLLSIYHISNLDA